MPPLKYATLHACFEHRARLQPEAIAARCGDATIGYGELDRRANILASELIAQGVSSESLVGVCVERSIGMLVAMLGILKAGGVYVPLDPNYPEDRLAYMVENASIFTAIVENATRDRIVSQQTHLLFLDGIDFEREAEYVVPTIAPEHLAYVMYTSGSTGQPKGVMIEHRNIVPFVTWISEYFTPAQFRYTLCANSLSFDVSIFEIFGTLVHGGTLVIVKNILSLLSHAELGPITTMIAAPSSVAEIVRAKRIPAAIDTMIFGGERLPISLVHELYVATGVQTVYHSWGVTEDTIGSAFIAVARDETHDPPMGHPIAGRSLYVLDAFGHRVAAGQRGELYCSGYGVARGYMHRDELNAERFLPNPFGDASRMYRTGDLAIEREDGALVFLGRDDQQIKLHGFRIELGEIESVLATHPSVAQAAVVAETQVGRLDMYVVAREDHNPTLAALQDHVGAHLPEYMIPSTLYIVSHIPFGPTGKVNRAELRTLVRNAEESDRPVAEMPSDPYERAIAALFTNILARPNVRITDDFFALGGKSLLAARLGTEVRERFPDEVRELEAISGIDALQTAFTFEPTVRYLAAVLQGKEQIPNRHDSLYCIQAGDSKRTPLFLFHGVINGEALYCYDLAHTLGPEQPFYALAPHGLDGDAVPETVEQMASDYVARIRERQAHGPYHFMGYCNGGLVAFEAARMLRKAGEHVATLVLIATPGHNVRHRVVKSFVDALDAVLGKNPQRSLRWFVASRDAVRLSKYRIEYIRDALPSILRGQHYRGPRPFEKLQQARRIGPQGQREHQSFRNIMKAVQAYVPQRYDGDVCIVWGKDDEYLGYSDPQADWSRVVSRLRVDFVEGDHHFLNTGASKLAEYVRIEMQDGGSLGSHARGAGPAG